MYKRILLLFFTLLSFLFYSCEKEWGNDNPLMEHIYYYGLGNVNFPGGNELIYNVEQNEIVEIPTYFFSSFTRSYSPEVYYYTSSVPEEEPVLVCGEDYIVVDKDGKTLTPTDNGGYSMVWPNAVKGVQNIYIKVLSNKKGDIRVLTFDPDKKMSPDDVSSTTIVKTDEYEVRAFTENYYVTVKINANNESTDTPETNENILAYWNFEGDNPIHDLKKEYIEDDETIIVADPLNDNNKAMYLKLPTGMDRKEVMWAEGNDNYYFYPNTNDNSHGDEFWIGFKVYVPKLSIVNDNKAPSIFQIGPISSSVQFDGSYGLYQLMAPQHFAYWRWRKFQCDYSPVGNITESRLSQLNYNQWEKFVIHCVLRDNTEGLIEIWKNGEKIYTLNQENAEPNTRACIKWGIYIGTGNSSTDTYECYFDEIKIGNSLSGYDAVLPK